MGTTPGKPAINIPEAFNVAWAKSFPTLFYQDDSSTPKAKSATAVLELEVVGGVLTLVNNLTLADRAARYAKLVANGYGQSMIYELHGLGNDPYGFFKDRSDDGIGYIPPAVLLGVPQKNLGQPGQYALPNAYEAGVNLGPYPEKMPEGWIKIPPMAALLAKDADVAAILKGWF